MHPRDAEALGNRIGRFEANAVDVECQAIGFSCTRTIASLP